MDERTENYQTQISQLAERIAESRGDNRAILRRLDGLEDDEKQQSGILVTLQHQADAIEALHEKVDKLAERMEGISDRVSEIEKEPGERWKKIGFEIIKYIVLAAVGAAIGYLSK